MDNQNENKPDKDLHLAEENQESIRTKTFRSCEMDCFAGRDSGGGGPFGIQVAGRTWYGKQTSRLTMCWNVTFAFDF